MSNKLVRKFRVKSVNDQGEVVLRKTFGRYRKAANFVKTQVLEKSRRVTMRKVYVPPDFHVHSRSEWGGALMGATLKLPVKMVFNHTPALPPATLPRLPKNATKAQKVERMKRVDGIGKARGFQGFSYSFYFFADGDVWEGRGFGRTQAATVCDKPDVCGNHNFNYDTYSFAFDGHGDHDAPTPEQIRAAVNLTKLLKTKGHAAKWVDQRGHREVAYKSCPGNEHTDADIQEVQRKSN